MCLAGLICLRLRLPSRTPLPSFLLSGHRAQPERSGGGLGQVGIILTPETKDSHGRPQGSLCCLVSGSSLW